MPPQPSPEVRQQIQKQQRLLLFLRHCAKCQDPRCSYGHHCSVGKDLWNHIVNCADHECNYPRCLNARELLRHYQKCSKHQCPICGPVRQVVGDSSGGATLRNREANRSMDGSNASAMMSMSSLQHQQMGQVPMQPTPHNGTIMPMSADPAARRGISRPREGPAFEAELSACPDRKRSRADMQSIKVRRSTWPWPAF
jgi:hypothetical protein